MLDRILFAKILRMSYANFVLNLKVAPVNQVDKKNTKTSEQIPKEEQPIENKAVKKKDENEKFYRKYIDYLMDTYGFDAKRQGYLTGLKNVKEDIKDEDQILAAQKVIIGEGSLLIKSIKEIIEEKESASFEDKPYNFNFKSVRTLVKATEFATRLIFFNTYIDFDDWHSPIVQTHLNIQKSIEQRNNLYQLHQCHQSNGVDAHKIISCTKNPPTYKHYRILFVPYTREEFEDKIKNKDDFYNNLHFSAHNHCLLSIQIALITVTELYEIIKSNKFFKEKENLQVLCLPASAALYDDEISEEIEKELKNALEAIGQIPSEQTNNGMDFLEIWDRKGDCHDSGLESENEKAKNEDNKEFHNVQVWNAFYDKEKGLTYSKNKELRISTIQSQFSEIVFNYITKRERPHDLPFNRQFDPLYEINKNRNIRRFDSEYDLMPTMTL